MNFIHIKESCYPAPVLLRAFAQMKMEAQPMLRVRFGVTKSRLWNWSGMLKFMNKFDFVVPTRKFI